MKKGRINTNTHTHTRFTNNKNTNNDKKNPTHYLCFIHAKTCAVWSVDICFIPFFIMSPFVSISSFVTRVLFYFFRSTIFISVTVPLTLIIWHFALSKSIVSNVYSSFSSIQIRLFSTWHATNKQKFMIIMIMITIIILLLSFTVFTLNILKVLYFLWFPVFRSVFCSFSWDYTNTHFLILFFSLHFSFFFCLCLCPKNGLRCSEFLQLWVSPEIRFQ